MPEPSEYTGLIKQNLQPTRITMVTCEVGEKVNFPYNYRGVRIQRLQLNVNTSTSQPS